MVSILDFESRYLGSTPSMTFIIAYPCQLGRVVKATDLKSVEATLVGSNPAADVCVIGLMVRIQPFQG